MLGPALFRDDEGAMVSVHFHFEHFTIKWMLDPALTIKWMLDPAHFHDGKLSDVLCTPVHFECFALMVHVHLLVLEVLR